MIDSTTVERIKDAMDIVDIISEFISLKKRGTNYIARCPFHDEKTGSFSVSPSKGIYKCFGCGVSGNAISFIMAHEQQSYIEALKWIAKKYNIEIIEQELTPEQKEQINRKESLFIVNSFAQKFFSKNLFETKDGVAIGLSYFNHRGFSEGIIKEFELGYSLNNWDDLSKQAIKEGYKQEYLLDLGLLKRNDKKNVYDTFKGRVIFPIHNLSGKVVGFGGRALSSENKAKYLNSPESDIYHKSKVLYGLFFAKKEISRQDKCFLVEGYTDVISMHQSGIKNVVASSGTALSIDQVRLIKRFTSNIIMLFDGDNAGEKATERGVEIALKEDMNVKIVRLPQGEDPDSFCKTHNNTEFNDFIIKNENDFILHKTKLIADKTKNDPIKKSESIKDIINTISFVTSEVTRAVYIKECATLMDIDEQIIYSELIKILNKKTYKERQQQINKPATQPSKNENNVKEKVNEKFEKFEDEIIRILLKYPDKVLFIIENEGKQQEITTVDYVFREISDEINFITNEYKVILKEVKDAFDNNKSIDIKYFINHNNQKLANKVIKILTDNYVVSKMWSKKGNHILQEENIVKEIIDNAISGYKYELVLEKLKDIEKQLKEYDNKSIEEEKMKDLLDEYMRYTEYKMDISNRLGNRIVLKH